MERWLGAGVSAVARVMLVVEDDRDTREVVSEILTSRGLAVVSAANGAEALELLERGLRPAAILLDVGMPIVDGFEFRRQQRCRDELAGIPTIVASAIRLVADELRQLDAAAYLPKPLGIRALEVAIAGALGEVSAESRSPA